MYATGNHPRVYETYSIGCSIFKNGKKAETFYERFKPKFCDVMDPRFLAKRNLSPEMIKRIRGNQRKAFKKFLGMLEDHIDVRKSNDRFIIAGFDGNRQAEHLREWFDVNGNNGFDYYFWKQSIDLTTLSLFQLKDKRHKLTNLKIPTIGRTLGMDINPELENEEETLLQVAEFVGEYMELH